MSRCRVRSVLICCQKRGRKMSRSLFVMPQKKAQKIVLTKPQKTSGKPPSAWRENINTCSQKQLKIKFVIQSEIGWKNVKISSLVAAKLAGNLPNVLWKNLQLCFYEKGWKMSRRSAEISSLVATNKARSCPNVSWETCSHVSTHEAGKFPDSESNDSRTRVEIWGKMCTNGEFKSSGDDRFDHRLFFLFRTVSVCCRLSDESGQRSDEGSGLQTFFGFI